MQVEGDNRDQNDKNQVKSQQEDNNDRQQVDMNDKERKKENDSGSDDDDQKKKKKSKKSKKNKKHNRQQDKEKQQQKYEQAVKNSFLHTVQSLSPQERQRYAEIENDPLKLICTNLPLKITIAELIKYFNQVITTTNPQLSEPPPIKDVQLDKHRTFAILELSQRRIKDFFSKHTDFTYIEGNAVFKVMRPKVFFEQKYGQKSKMTAILPGERVYIGGLPHYFTDQQVKKICETFGKLKYITIIKQNGVSKGYGFFEYQDPRKTDKAIQALNNLPIADRRLKCQKATVGSGRTASLPYVGGGQIPIGQQVPKAKAANHSGSYLVSYQNIQDVNIQKTLSNNLECKTPSRVIQFLNMFYIEDLFDEDTYEDLKADLQEQCAKYGPVEKIVIPRPDTICGYSPPTVGKAFVKFMYIIAAKRARIGIAGKVYNKRTVVTSFYPQEKFNMREYLVNP